MGTRFAEFYKQHGISHHLTSMAHPLVNGELEVTNLTLLQGLKDKLGKTKGSWADELYYVL